MKLSRRLDIRYSISIPFHEGIAEFLINIDDRDNEGWRLRIERRFDGSAKFTTLIDPQRGMKQSREAIIGDFIAVVCIGSF